MKQVKHVRSILSDTGLNVGEQPKSVNPEKRERDGRSRLKPIVIALPGDHDVGIADQKEQPP